MTRCETVETTQETPIAAPIPTDAELLFAYFQQGNQEAFRDIVRRHAPMVSSVCRQIVRSEPDVQDACQATFIVLARRGMTLRRSSSLAGWLHRVAYRIACQQFQANRREDSEVSVDATAPASEVLATISRQEEASVLHEELAKLPRRYREPIILHYFESLPREETAERLDTTDAAVKARLAKGRRLLRSRLMQRGVGLAVGLEIAMRQCRAFAGHNEFYGNDFAERLPTPASERVGAMVIQEIRRMRATVVRRVAASVAVIACLVIGQGVAGRGAGAASDQQAAAVVRVSPADDDGQQDSKTAVQIAAAEDRPEEAAPDFEPRPLPTIRAGDVLGISVPGSPSDQPIHGTYEVEPSGTVALGASYGRVVVGGLDALQAERAIAKRLASLIGNPEVSVTYGSLPGDAPPRARDSNVLPRGPLQMGETLRVRVISQARVFEETTPIDANGDIVVPVIYERLPAASLSVQELEGKIRGVVEEKQILLAPVRVLVTRVSGQDDAAWQQQIHSRLDRIEQLLRARRDQ